MRHATECILIYLIIYRMLCINLCAQLKLANNCYFSFTLNIASISFEWFVLLILFYIYKCANRIDANEPMNWVSDQNDNSPCYYVALNEHFSARYKQNIVVSKCITHSTVLMKATYAHHNKTNWLANVYQFIWSSRK